MYGADAKNTDLAPRCITWGMCTSARQPGWRGDKYGLEMKRRVRRRREEHGLGTTLENLGIVYRQRGNLDGAETKYEEALEMMRHVAGADAKNTDLAGTLRTWGLCTKRQPGWRGDQVRRTLEMKRHVYGADAKNTDLAGTLQNLGMYGQRGNLDGAETKYEEALEMKRHVYGADAKNTDLAGTLQNLGIVYGQRGNLDGAETKYEEALEMKRRVRRGKNTDLARTLGTWGMCTNSAATWMARRPSTKKP